jgi:hypothetical protein
MLEPRRLTILLTCTACTAHTACCRYSDWLRAAQSTGWGSSAGNGEISPGPRCPDRFLSIGHSPLHTVQTGSYPLGSLHSTLSRQVPIHWAFPTPHCPDRFLSIGHSPLHIVQAGSYPLGIPHSTVSRQDPIHWAFPIPRCLDRILSIGHSPLHGV